MTDAIGSGPNYIPSELRFSHPKTPARTRFCMRDHGPRLNKKNHVRLRPRKHEEPLELLFPVKSRALQCQLVRDVRIAHAVSRTSAVHTPSNALMLQAVVPGDGTGVPFHMPVYRRQV